VSELVVADAGPLIALARTGHLALLKGLFDRVLIPAAVRDELELASDRPGARELSTAIASEDWLLVEKVRVEDTVKPGPGQGEREAILLASRKDALLIIDDNGGRRAAQSAGVRVIGTGRVLIAAKQRGLIGQVSPILDELTGAGYRLSVALVKRLRELAGEA
jgi:predicted nucleic acid-binding protein